MSKVNRAYIGFSGPIGYAYAHKRPKLENESSSPNAVLENVGGLLICYDELYFPTKNFCPVDMWDLPYVHFLLDDEGTRQQTLTAIDQAIGSEIPNELNRRFDFDVWSPITEAMQGGSKNAAIDNHTHGIEIGEDLYLSGNAADPMNVLIDIVVAQALSVLTEDTDLILSSPSLSSKMDSVAGISENFTVPQRTLADEIIALYNENFLSPRGSYHESYEELRAHSNIREFREMLTAVDVGMHDVSELAIEVNRQAEEFSSKNLRKAVKGLSWFRSMGMPSLAIAADMIASYSGTLGQAVVTRAMDAEWNKELKNMSWAPFVLDAGIRGRYGK